MLIKTNLGMAALLLTAEQVNAKFFRPLPGTAPWHKEGREGEWYKLDYPIDYPVPNFGMDHDIVSTHKNMKDAEKKLGAWNPVKDPETKKYVVPTASAAQHPQALQQLQSDPICSSAGCNYKEKKAAATHPMDYFVPDFGMDHEIQNVDQSLHASQVINNHTWDYVKDTSKPTPPTEYNTEPTLDSDVLNTHAHMEAAEQKLGKWEIEELQTQQDNGKRFKHHF